MPCLRGGHRPARRGAELAELREVLFEDEDFAFLFEARLDGIETDPRIQASLHMANLAFSAWQKPFNPRRHVHPFVDGQGRASWVSRLGRHDNLVVVLCEQLFQLALGRDDIKRTHAIQLRMSRSVRFLAFFELSRQANQTPPRRNNGQI